MGHKTSLLCTHHQRPQLTRNTNEFNINGSRGRDVTAPGFSSAPFDCQFAPATTGPNGTPYVHVCFVHTALFFS